MLKAEMGVSAKLARTVTLIKCVDGLEVKSVDSNDPTNEVGNPPYRRLPRSANRRLQTQFKDIDSGRLNLYAMFVRRALDRVQPGRLVAFVLPASFLGGPEFRAFRKRILQLAHVRVIDVVEKRRDLFLDATQDACFLVLEKRGENSRVRNARCGVLRSDGSYQSTGTVALPKNGSHWNLARTHTLKNSATLSDWGYRATIGYLVSNRQPERLFRKPGRNRYPLIWAKAITPDGQFDFERSADFRDKIWASAPMSASYLIRTPCVALQRVSAPGQRRRLTAGVIPKSFLQKHRGVIGENHVIFLLPLRKNAVSPSRLAAALNAPEASQLFDRISGSSSISARLLEVLPLPPAP
jgi:adenine-specific DNA-methyltransferase